MDNLEHIGYRIEYIAKSRGISISKLAAEMEVSQAALSHLINGRNKPSYDILVKLISYFTNVNASWLLTGKGDMQINDDATGITTVNEPRANYNAGFNENLIHAKAKPGSYFDRYLETLEKQIESLNLRLSKLEAQ